MGRSEIYTTSALRIDQGLMLDIDTVINFIIYYIYYIFQLLLIPYMIINNNIAATDQIVLVLFCVQYILSNYHFDAGS